MAEQIIAYGHRNITSRHKTTIEFTKDDEISKRADCIIGIKANKGIKDLSEEFKNRARNKDAIIEVTITVGDIEEKILGQGHPELSFDHKTDIVIRKSEFVCRRTLMILADKSSRELNKELVEKLKNPKQELKVTINVK